MIEELLEEIQTFLNNENITRDEEQEYERLLAEFNQIPSYVERFTRREEEQKQC
jgi:hypothetical protein